MVNKVPEKAFGIPLLCMEYKTLAFFSSKSFLKKVLSKFPGILVRPMVSSSTINSPVTSFNWNDYLNFVFKALMS